MLKVFEVLKLAIDLSFGDFDNLESSVKCLMEQRENYN